MTFESVSPEAVQEGEGRVTAADGGRDVSWLAMACFVEGIEPSSLSLSPRHLIRVEEVLRELLTESETISYYRCLEALSNLENRAEPV